MLNQIEQNTILSALRNGLGLTHACRGLHRSPKEVSEFIITTAQFHTQCQQQCIAGYQAIIIDLNTSQNKKAWDRWRTSRSYIEQFISTLNLWESFCKKEDFNFMNATLSIKHCKIIPEAATAMGFTEIEFQTEIFKDTKLIQWLLQNGHEV